MTYTIKLFLTGIIMMVNPDFILAQQTNKNSLKINPQFSKMEQANYYEYVNGHNFYPSNLNTYVLLFNKTGNYHISDSIVVQLSKDNKIMYSKKEPFSYYDYMHLSNYPNEKNAFVIRLILNQPEGLISDLKEMELIPLKLTVYLNNKSSSLYNNNEIFLVKEKQ